ncbi:AmmeMemoRadiSam system protein A, partial [bacterium]|nr:AmmeMemoRadiSam system protein A [bacterium]
VLKGNFKIVPILFGNTGEELYLDLAEAFKNNLGDSDIVIFSTDMSHYPDHKDANKIDKKTLEFISKGDIKALEAHKEEVMALGIKNEETILCGIDGIKTAMELISKGFWGKAKVLYYLNSGDTKYGDKKQVVGYGAVAFERQVKSRKSLQFGRQANVESELTTEQQNILLKIAQETVEAQVKGEKQVSYNIQDERLNWKEGAFVTLHKNKKLRGCIGQIAPSDKPLWQVVQDMAIAAATEDHRFQPVSKKDLSFLDYEVSVLSRPKRVDNWQDIELGKHGVIIGQGFNSGVFLPQVADETGWDKETFLSELCSQKAGLAANCYKDNNTEIQIFTAQVFGE